jgi:Xaa-Pro aminopeptidase
MQTTISTRIKALRFAMRKNGICACIIPSSDPHQSEYIPDFWNAMSYFSGFSGSNGTLVVTQDNAGLWTDSRYFIQAEAELSNSNIHLFRLGDFGDFSLMNWILSEVKEKNIISLYSLFFSIKEMENYSDFLNSKKITINSDFDLISECWGSRPPLPQSEIFVHKIKYAGESSHTKIKKIQSLLHSKNADLLIINSLDEIAWIFNLRGNDIPYNPVFLSYCIITTGRIILFACTDSFQQKSNIYLKNLGIDILDYSTFFPFIKTIQQKTIWLDFSKTNYETYKILKTKNHFLNETSPISILKAIKNKTEIKNVRKAMIKDGIALTKFFIWFEKCPKSNIIVDEIAISQKLTSFRREQSNFFSESFSTIAGYNSNGAIVHYHPKPATNKQISGNGLLLIDSGGQYFEGTTDITRTVCIGSLNKRQKKDFTLVLKGHIALACANFPKGTYGYQLDSFARKPLWVEGLSYGHGTGHGVGSFLCVHEGPQSIRPDQNKTVLQQGMILSNEPGVYKENEYGIRIENLLLVTESLSTNGFLKFETLTLFPIDKNAIDFNLLTTNEINWLIDYHKIVYKKLAPHLSVNEKRWLKKKCKF